MREMPLPLVLLMLLPSLVTGAGVQAAFCLAAPASLPKAAPLPAARAGQALGSHHGQEALGSSQNSRNSCLSCWKLALGTA